MIISKKNLYRGIGVGILGALSLSAIHCSPSPSQYTSSGIDETDAQGQLDQRKARTQELRVQLEDIRKALQPIDDVLRDLGKAVDLRVGGTDGTGKVDSGKLRDAIQGLLARFEQALKDGTSGMVQKNDDGSWVLDRSLSNDTPLVGNCSTGYGRLRIVGTQVSQGQLFTVSASLCSQPDVFQTLAMLTVRANGSREISISASSFVGIQLQKTATADFDPCHLTIDVSGYATLNCSEFSVGSGDYSIDFRHFSLYTGTPGTYASANLEIDAVGHGSLGSVRADLLPGQPLSLRVCAPDDGSCAQ